MTQGTTVSLGEFQRLELRAATVLAARPHPKADKLMVLDVDVGEKHKQVVAGILPYRAAEELVGRQIIVADNLEPALLRGERSEGMLLAILDGNDLALLVPDRPVRPGSRVT